MDDEQNALFKKYNYYGKLLECSLNEKDDGQKRLKQIISDHRERCSKIANNVKTVKPEFYIEKKKVVFNY